MPGITAYLASFLRGCPAVRDIFMFLALFLVPFTIFPQQKKYVHIEKADVMKLDKQKGRDIQKLIGNVRLRQDSTLFYCDSALLDNANNVLEAFGNVHINYNDSVDIYGDHLIYSSDTKLARLDSNVVLRDNTATLTTDHLLYNRNMGWAYYTTGGRIVDGDNVLVSEIGRYFTKRKEFFFKDSVVLTNPDYVLRSDTLMYNTETEISYIYGPTTITGEEDSIYCERGWYDTERNTANLLRNAVVVHLEQSIRADSIYYDREAQYGSACYNITITDTLQNIVVLGQTAEFDRRAGYSYVTDSVVAILVDQPDSLFLHADTIRVLNDKEGHAEFILAWYKMRFFRTDLQGMSDSLSYHVKDSAIILYDSPVLWSDESQLTSDSVYLFLSENQVDSMILYNSAFIISRDDSNNMFNQIKGRDMTAYFYGNELKRIRVTGNAQTLYFVREEDSTLIGVNKSLSSYMSIYLIDGKVKNIAYIEEADLELLPAAEVDLQNQLLKDFRWLSGLRPVSKKDIFPRKEEE